MIKIPATDEGIPAIEEALYEGLNVNVTLLFAVGAYERVMEAFVRAMERRHEEGKPLDRHSVASFFVSRVDTEVDKRLEALGRTDLAGRAGLANARAAYLAFQRVFEGERFAALREAGCPVQRPLWASTGVKNPQYPETLYVDGLVGPHTVNTMPLPTLLAARAGGRGDRRDGRRGPAGATSTRCARPASTSTTSPTSCCATASRRSWSRWPSCSTASSASARRSSPAARPRSRPTCPPSSSSRSPSACKRAAEEDVARRIWQRDGTLWAPEGTPEVTDRLGWLTIADKMLEEADALDAFVAECKADGLTDAVLLGMGGSSLAPEVFRLSYGDAGRPAAARARLDRAAADRGRRRRRSTSRRRCSSSRRSRAGRSRRCRCSSTSTRCRATARHFVAVTDPGSSLVDLAEEHGFRRTFLNDPEIGGRYSALSYFGLVPAALAGIDVRPILEGAQVAEQACSDFEAPEDNAGLWLGLALGELARAGRDKLTFVVDDPIGVVRDLGRAARRREHGQAGPRASSRSPTSRCSADAYGQDRVFLHLRNTEAPDAEPRRPASPRSPRPGTRPSPCRPPGADDLGRVFFLSEFATAVVGLGARDQPVRPAQRPAGQGRDARRCSTRARPTSRTATSPRCSAASSRPATWRSWATCPTPRRSRPRSGACARRSIERHHVATTYGYGPRFLHSTGQFHKGGPAVGRFLQLVQRLRRRRGDPGRASSTSAR